MSLDQGLLKGTQSREWIVAKPPTGASPQWVYTGRDESGLGPIYVALASISAPPSRETMRALHAAYKGKSNIQLVIGAVLGNQVWIFGPDEKTEVTEPLALDQGCRQLQSALDEPDAIAAYTRLGQFRRSLDTTSLVGVTNSGLFASYHIRENVPKRNDWKEACEKSKPLLALRNEHLIKALGFKSEKTAGNALLLSTGTPQSKAVAILLDETEQFDATSARHTGISPVAFGLNVAARQGVPWLFVLRKDQIRIYPAKDGVGVGQKGQVETYLEIDLAAIDSERAGLLTLIFSADALEPNGTANDLLLGSQLFASQLGSRLRERIYEHVVPQLSKSVAEHLREQGTNLDSEGLSLAYRLTLRILFRLLFQAYAEDRGLLPAGRNEAYDANSLKTIAKRIINTPEEQFGKSKTLWFDLVQVWDAIDEGNETWNVPAYNGGLFGTDPGVHPEGALIEKLGIQDEVLGSVLQHLLLDVSEDGVLGPVDFRSLSVREFGTIYEGLLESSLSVANENLTVDAKGAWVSALKTDQVFAKKGEVYFHSASGERKATGSYFTPSVIVDHLITRSLDTALDIHLERIRELLLQGNEAEAARCFFDFRVADLAMGSGHFLVAAVDRIEAKMRIFLAEKETSVPGVNAELNRLAHAAKLALGRDVTAFGDIEPAALLRRQIARRCIYGLDINPLAVELARLALWIHTFVPGLPMSSLDHGLVCANSLTGVGTIDEALEVLVPGNVSGQISIFENIITDKLHNVRDLLLEVANSDEATKSEIRASANIAKQARDAAEPVKKILDVAVGARLGLIDMRMVFEENSILDAWEIPELQRALHLLKPAHLPFLFPEVFIRENPGFDVLIGNPPWEKLHIEEHQWWGLHIPGLRGLKQVDYVKALQTFRDSRPDLEIEFKSAIEAIDYVRAAIANGPFPGLGSAHIDLYQVFAWKNLQLVKSSGVIALVLPRGAMSGTALKKWREEVIKQGSFKNVCFLLNSGGWVFEGVHAQYTIALAIIQKSNDHEINFTGPFSSIEEFLEGREDLASATPLEFASWSGSLAFPLIPNADSGNVFKKMRKHPRFDDPTLGFEFQPIQGDINATTDKNLIDFSGTEGIDQLDVIGGSAYGLWNPNHGDRYGQANSSLIRSHLLRKVTAASTNPRSAYFELREWKIDDLPIDSARIAIRDITNRTNTRTVICCLIPPLTVTTHRAPTLVRRLGTEIDEAFLLGILSSRVFDWYMRRWVELVLSFELLNPAPIPKLNSDDYVYRRIVEISIELASVDKRFDAWASKAGMKQKGRLSEEEREKRIYELDALVAHSYGLNEKDLKTIFENFHRGWNWKPYLDQSLVFFNQIKEHQND